MIDDLIGLILKMIGINIGRNFGFEGVLVFLAVCALFFFAAVGVLVLIRRLRGS